eukprot:CAMPEP_0183442236 /NCGR_PEP_ID=MMETSP0370-20130417/87540_1 /TAXON_ID=268820 /ORGANISM="Peridinium aciculiferum, Strain PAER-2" /LENGTH=57 /DNA_ID=CAMNT_0025631791 /DNA_START=74 /DNA_END=244 /DNA_ORIENTATION=+
MCLKFSGFKLCMLPKPKSTIKRPLAWSNFVMVPCFLFSGLPAADCRPCTSTRSPGLK